MNKTSTFLQIPKLLLTELPGAIFKCCVENGKVSIPFASPGIWDLFELKLEDVQKDAQTLFMRIDPNDIRRLKRIARSSPKYSHKWEIDYQVHLPIKGSRWIRTTAKTQFYDNSNYICYGYTTDVTERKKAARALLQKEERLHFALESSEEGIWDYNFPKKSLFLSSRFLERFGLAHETSENLDFWLNFIHPEDIKMFKVDFLKYLRGKNRIFTTEARIKCFDGSYKWVLYKGKIIAWDRNNLPVRMVGTHADITLRKIRELELEEHIRTVKNQNSRLSNFAYIVSHNLRTHTSNLEILLQFIENAESQEEKDIEFGYLKSISRQLSETIMHLNEVLSIQNKKNLELKNHNLYGYIKKVEDMLNREIKYKNVLLINNVHKELFIDYNSAYLESILYNLLSNSIKYADSTRQPVINIDCYRKDKYRILKISDNGQGMNIEKIGSDLFGMYKTFHGNKDAKGIGLFITKNQVEAMGGKIEVESVLNAGTTFYVYIKSNFSG